MTKNINLYIYINITVSSCLETFLYFLVCKLNELISLNEKYLNCPVQITSKLGLFFFSWPQVYAAEGSQPHL